MLPAAPVEAAVIEIAGVDVPLDTIGAVPVTAVTPGLSPVFVPDKFATSALANIPLEIAPLAITVAFPTLVTVPVKLAFVVTVAALPVILV